MLVSFRWLCYHMLSYLAAGSFIIGEYDSRFISFHLTGCTLFHPTSRRSALSLRYRRFNLIQSKNQKLRTVLQERRKPEGTGECLHPSQRTHPNCPQIGLSGCCRQIRAPSSHWFTGWLSLVAVLLVDLGKSCPHMTVVSSEDYHTQPAEANCRAFISMLMNFWAMVLLAGTLTVIFVNCN